MKRCIALLLAALLALSMFTTAFAATYKDKATVKAVQQALNDAGYNCGTPDGSAGKKTKAAIESYQTDHDLEVTREIDDALLEALGLAEEQGEAEPNAEPAAEAEADAGEGEAASADARDPQVMAQLYNIYYLDLLMRCGVDIEGGEDIGQEDYLIANVSGGQLISFNESVVLKTGTPYSYAYLKLKGDGYKIDLKKYAAIYSIFCVLNAYYGGNGDTLDNELAMLGEPPQRDGTVSLLGMKFFEKTVESDDFAFSITGHKEKEELQLDFARFSEEDRNMSELPEEIAAQIGSIPDTIDGYADRYDLEALKTLPEQLDLSAMKKSLDEEGKCTFDALGYKWTKMWTNNMYLDISVSGDQVTAVRTWEKSEEEEFLSNYEYLSMLSENGIQLSATFDLGESDASWVKAEYSIDGNTENYREYHFELESEVNGYSVECTAYSNDGVRHTWTAKYDALGNLITKNHKL